VLQIAAEDLADLAEDNLVVEGVLAVDAALAVSFFARDRPPEQQGLDRVALDLGHHLVVEAVEEPGHDWHVGWLQYLDVVE